MAKQFVALFVLFALAAHQVRADNEDIDSAKDLSELLKIAQGERELAENKLKTSAEGITDSYHTGADSLKNCSDKLEEQMKEGKEECNKSDDVEAFQGKVQEFVEEQDKRDFVAEFNENSRIQRAFKKIDEEADHVKSVAERCENRRCTIQFALEKGHLKQNRFRFDHALRRSNVGSEVADALSDFQRELKDMEGQFGECNGSDDEADHEEPADETHDEPAVEPQEDAE